MAFSEKNNHLWNPLFTDSTDANTNSAYRTGNQLKIIFPSDPLPLNFYITQTELTHSY